MTKNTLAIIPARSGSKGLKNKNIKLIKNKPLVAYTVEAAMQSKCFDTIHISTDSQEYAKIAISFGAEAPFLRKKSLAQDQSTTWDMVRYVLEQYKKRDIEYRNICVLQPTSPLRSAEDIKKAFELMKEKHAECVVSVCEAEHSPLLCGTLPENNAMDKFFDNALWNIPRQKLPQYYRLNGAIYLFNTNVIYDYATLYDSNCYALIMQPENSIDIDSELDFKFAETIINEREKNK